MNVGKVGKMDRKIVLGAQDILQQLGVACGGLALAVIGRMTIDDRRGRTSAQRNRSQGHGKDGHCIRCELVGTQRCAGRQNGSPPQMSGNTKYQTAPPDAPCATATKSRYGL